MNFNGAQIHLLLNHFPVIAYPIIALALLWSFIRKEPQVFTFSIYLIIFTWIITFATYLTGEGAEDTLRDLPNFNIDLIHAHENTALIAMILSSIISVASIATLPVAQKFFSFLTKPKVQLTLRYGILVGVILITIIFGIAAHQGGIIVHSEIR